MLYILYGVLIFLGIYVHVNKKYDWFVLIFLSLICGLSVDKADFQAYSNVYAWIRDGQNYMSTGVGWLVLCKTGNLFHLTYSGFSIIIAFASLYLIKTKIDSYTFNSKFVWGMYLVFPSFLDLVQLRGLIAVAIIIYAIPLLLDSKMKSKVIYTCLIIIASSIHIFSLFFILFLLADIIGIKKRKIIPVVVVLVIGFIYLFWTGILDFISIFEKTGRVEIYLSSRISIPAIIIYMLCFVSNYSLVHNVAINYVGNNHISKFVKLVESCNMISFLAIPLIVFSADFMRIWRVLFIINLIVFSLKPFQSKNKRILYKTTILLYSVCANIAFINWPSFAVVTKALLSLETFPEFFN